MKPLAKGTKARRRVVGLSLVALYVALTLFVFNLGKGYYVYVDNSDTEDGLAEAIMDGVIVQIDDNESAEYYARDRDKFRLRGREHRVRLELLADGAVIEKTVDVGGLGDNVLLSIPKLAAGIEPATSRFEAIVFTAPAEEPVPAEGLEALGQSAPPVQ